jgi:hypothetical protein
MRMFWNGVWTVRTGEKGRTNFVHVLRAATIVAVAWSCVSPASTSEGQQLDDEPVIYPPPPVKSLPTEEGARFLDREAAFLASNDIEGVQNVQIVTIAYTDQDGNEQLIAFRFGGSEVADPNEPEENFKIPPLDVAFDRAQCTIIEPPARVTSCGTVQTATGGTRYRSCIY